MHTISPMFRLIRDHGDSSPFVTATAVGLIIVTVAAKIVLRVRFMYLTEQVRRIIVFVVVLLYMIIAAAIGVALGAAE